MNEINYTIEITDKFLKAYRRIEQIQKDDPDSYDYFYSLYSSKFDMFRAIRNNLTHNTLNYKYPLIVSSQVLIELESLIYSLEVTVDEIGTSINDLKSLTLNDTLSNALDIMNKYSFANLPIVENGILSYVITDKSIVNLLAEYKKDNLILDLNLPISYYKKYFSLNYDKHTFLFVKKNTLAYQAKRKFNSYLDNKKCLAVFVTTDGQASSKLLRIITSSDFLKVR